MTWKQVEVESDEVVWFISGLQQQTSKETIGSYVLVFNKKIPPSKDLFVSFWNSSG